MGYCDGLCPYLDSKKHRCEQTGERLGYIKGWWGTTYEHHRFAACNDENKGLKDGGNNTASRPPGLLQ